MAQTLTSDLDGPESSTEPPEAVNVEDLMSRAAMEGMAQGRNGVTEVEPILPQTRNGGRGESLRTLIVKHPHVKGKKAGVSLHDNWVCRQWC
jgi:hypothetical protein